MYKSFAICMLLGAASARSLKHLNADATSLSELLRKNNEVPISMAALSDDDDAVAQKEEVEKKKDDDGKEEEDARMKKTEEEFCANGACKDEKSIEKKED